MSGVPLVLIGLAAVLALVLLWASWRAVVIASPILAAQLYVIDEVDDRLWLLVVLIVPALLTGFAVAVVSYALFPAREGRRCGEDWL